MSYLSLPLSCALLVGCASAPAVPEGAGERGLDGLRHALQMSPVVGHVERVGDESWLVHDETGLRLARVEPLPAGATGKVCGRRDGAPAIAFEGDPGVVLTFDPTGGNLWQLDPDVACAIPRHVFETEPAPPMTKLAELDSTKATAREVAVIVPGRPAPVRVVLGQDGVEVHDGDDVLDFQFPVGTRCAFSAAIEGGLTNNGVQYFYVDYTIGTTAGTEDGTCHLGDDDGFGSEHTGELWIELAPQRKARIVEQSDTPPIYGDNDATFSCIVDLPQGQLEFVHTMSLTSGREGPSRGSTWEWRLQTPNGATRVLASDE